MTIWYLLIFHAIVMHIMHLKVCLYWMTEKGRVYACTKENARWAEGGTITGRNLLSLIITIMLCWTKLILWLFCFLLLTFVKTVLFNKITLDDILNFFFFYFLFLPWLNCFAVYVYKKQNFIKVLNWFAVKKLH